MNECHYYLEPRNHTLYPLLLSIFLRSMTRGTMWNHVEPTSSEGARQARASIQFYVVGKSHSRHHAVVLKCVAVSPERPRSDDKLATTNLFYTRR